MNPPGTKASQSARFPWSKGVMRHSSPGTLRLGGSDDLMEVTGGDHAPRPLPIVNRKRTNTGIAFCRDARHGRSLLENDGVWVGRLTGPVLWAVAVGGFLSLASPAGAAEGGRGTGGLLSDGLPRYSQPLRTAPEDLALRKANERVAEALAAFAEGVAAEQNADEERALEAYQRALALDASNTALAVKVAFTLAQQKQVPQAIDILKDAEKASPKDLLPPLCLSQIYEKFLNKPQLAERYALRAQRLSPTNIGPYLALYEIYVNSKQQKKAEAILKKAADAPTEEPLFWLQLAEAQIQHESERGPNFPKEIAESIAPLLEKAVKGNEREIATLSKAADLYVQIWRIDEAISLYQKVVALSPAPNSVEMLQVREKLARCLLAGKNPAEGVAVLEGMIRDGPSRLDTYELLAEWYFLQEDFDHTVEIYRRALNIDSSQAKFYLRIAQILHGQEKLDDAVKTLTSARRQFPRQAQITYTLAHTLLQAERYKEAMAMFAHAEREGRYSNDEILSAEFFFLYGMAAERSGDLALAAQHLRRSIELDPSNAAEAYNYLGYMWADGGVHLEEALELIQQALRKEPENGAYLDSLGWVYYRMGKYPQAIETLRQAIDRMEVKEAVMFDHLGDALHASGKTEEALENWKQALELDPENSEIKEKLSQTANAPGENGAKPTLTTTEP